MAGIAVNGYGGYGASGSGLTTYGVGTGASALAKTAAASATASSGSAASSATTSGSGGTAALGANGKPLSASDQAEIKALKKRDADVRAHEHAHESAGGQYAGAPSYTYQKGPDGTNYAIGGEVDIDTSPIKNDPAGTLAKMQQVQRAALAPADPSGQDQHVAAEAAAAAAQAKTQAQKSQSAATAQGGQAATNFQAQTIGSNQTDTQTGANNSGAGNSGAGNSGGDGNTSAAAITAAAAQAGSAGTPGSSLFSRGFAAYGAAAGLGASQSNHRLGVVA